MKVGVILGGGGVRGAAHIGVLRELKRLGLRPAAIAGTSSGGLVGALYACGCDWDEVEKLARSLTPALALGLRWPFQKAKPTLLRLIEKYVENRRFEDLAVPLVISAFDVPTSRDVLFDSGPLLPALRATIALPLLFPPARTPQGEVLVDGGIITTLPVQALLGKVDAVIAVDVRAGHPERIPQPRWRRRRWMFFQAYHALAQKVTEGHLSHAQLVLRPDVADVPTLDFKQVGRCIEAGARVVHQFREAIDSLISRAQPGTAGREPAQPPLLQPVIQKEAKLEPS